MPTEMFLLICFIWTKRALERFLARMGYHVSIQAVFSLGSRKNFKANWARKCISGAYRMVVSEKMLTLTSNGGGKSISKERSRSVHDALSILRRGVGSCPAKTETIFYLQKLPYRQLTVTGLHVRFNRPGIIKPGVVSFLF